MNYYSTVTALLHDFLVFLNKLNNRASLQASALKSPRLLFGEKRSLHRGMCGKGTRGAFPEVWTIANRLDDVNSR